MASRFQKCRLCLKLGDFCSIYEQDESIRLSDMVMTFANIQIHEGDGLPDRVCTGCIENLSTAYYFKLQCERVNQMLKKTPNVNIDQPDGATDHNAFLNQEFHLHNGFNSTQGENDQNSVIDAHNEQISNRNHYFSEETDSDIESIKCVYCDQSHSNVHGHTCNVTCTIEHNALQQSSSNETLVANDFNTTADMNSTVWRSCLESTPTQSQNEQASPEVNSGVWRSCVESPPRDPPTQPVSPEVNSTVWKTCLDTTLPLSPTQTVSPESTPVSCVLCDEKYDRYNDYAHHINECTKNVKLHYFVCPICHEMYTEKFAYLDHMKMHHFRMSSWTETDSTNYADADPGEDSVDFAPIITQKTRRPLPVRRQIGWSIEDIYQEIDCRRIEEKPAVTPNSSPLKNFFSKLGNESFSRQSTPKKVSFRKWIETSKEKTTSYLPFKKYIQNYKHKKSLSTYSPIKNKVQITGHIQAVFPEVITDSDYNSPSGTSEESWKLKQNLICACDKKVFMLSEFIRDRDKIVNMIHELGGVVAENTKMEMLATHFISVMPNDTFTGMMVCALATGKWLLHVSYVYESFRCKKFLREDTYEWMRHPKIIEIDKTSVEVIKAAVYWHLELQALHARFPFEGKQIVLIMKRKYRQYYNMIFKTLKAKTVTYDPRTPGSCCNADYCFVDMKVIEKVKLRFFAQHNVPVFPYQYILVYLLKRGKVEDENKYLLQDCKILSKDSVYYFNKSY